MDKTDVVEEFRAVIAEIDRVRPGLMADQPRRTTYLQTVKVQKHAEDLLVRAKPERHVFKFAAE